MPRIDKRLWTFTSIAFAIGILIGATSAVQIAPQFQTSHVVAGPSGPTLPTVGPSGTSGPFVNDTTGPVPTAGPSDTVVPPGLQCARGLNGGATDTGVTGDKIMLATTTVQSREGAAFLGEVKFAMEAVKNKVNREGGICGRMLEITYVDDGWEAPRGSTYLKNFIEQGVFAIPVGASSEGLGVMIKSGAIDRAGIPVVGTDGLVIDQYTDKWVWPVATATVSSARIMARNAHERGARKFGIVFDNNYRFGVEAAAAYNNEVRLLTGDDVEGFNSDNSCQKAFCGIRAGESSYATQVQEFNSARFDFVAMFLEPVTALTWMGTVGAPRASGPTYGIGAGQPLFTYEFGNNCQAACDGMWVWTGYRPPIESYRDEPAVRTYLTDLKRTKPDADEYNAFSEGGYTGMQLLVEGLKKVGPYLTRERLRQALDSMSFDNGLTVQDKLAWRPGNHFANTTMRAFIMKYSGTFSGWRAGVTEKDLTPTVGIG